MICDITFENIVVNSLVCSSLLKNTPIFGCSAHNFVNCKTQNDLLDVIIVELNLSQKNINLKSKLNTTLKLHSENIGCFGDLIKRMYVQHKFMLQITKNYKYYSDPKIINIAIDRYVKFMELIKNNPDKQLVPTLEIDVVWHSYQLNHFKYSQYCINLMGNLINHNDSVIDEDLTDSYKTTCDIWENKYKEKYHLKYNDTMF